MWRIFHQYSISGILQPPVSADGRCALFCLPHETGARREDMSLVEMLARDPGMDTENEWLFPKLAKINYFGLLVLFILATFAIFIFAAIRLFSIFMGNASANPGEFFMCMVGLIIALPVILLLGCVWIRLLYEFTILLFRIFQSQRDTVKELAKTNENLAHISHTQIKCGQYICDTLATINDTLSKK